MLNLSFRVRAFLLVLILYPLIAEAQRPATCEATPVLPSKGNASSGDTPSEGNPSVGGTFARPFSTSSPWNSRPVEPKLSSQRIPPDRFFPSVHSGDLSVAVFCATEKDSSIAVYGLNDGLGILDADAMEYRESITIPHWPSKVHPPSGADGHTDIVDISNGVVHSFWKLRRINDKWRASLYAWSSLNGRGWGDPAHWYQGARATGVPSMGGLIRMHEVEDGDTVFRHALAISLASTGLSRDPAYIYPATSADNDAHKTNSGTIPEGALLMLPRDFDTKTIESPLLRKIAETLKIYGGYVVDRNVGTPFLIYAEMGSNVALHPPGGWNARAGSDLVKIQTALRVVTGARKWLDAGGTEIQHSALRFNLMSLRGPWKLIEGATAGRFYTATQSLEFPESGGRRIVQENTSGNGFNRVWWGSLVPGRRYNLSVEAKGGATLRLILEGEASSVKLDTGVLSETNSFSFVMPDGVSRFTLRASSGFSRTKSSVRAALKEDN